MWRYAVDPSTTRFKRQRVFRARRLSMSLATPHPTRPGQNQCKTHDRTGRRHYVLGRLIKRCGDRPAVSGAGERGHLYVRTDPFNDTTGKNRRRYGFRHFFNAYMSGKALAPVLAKSYAKIAALFI